MSLQTDYDSFNKYRGDMEQRRVSTDDKFITERNEKRRELIQSGLKPGSRDYNSKMESVHKTYADEVGKMDEAMAKFEESAKVKRLQKSYEVNEVFDKERESYMSQADYDRVKPSFDEYVTQRFGSPQEQEEGNLRFNRRITNLRSMQ